MNAAAASVSWSAESTGFWVGQVAGAQIWFTGRQGGVSPPPFDTLNVSRAVKDLPAAVAENRRRAATRGAPTAGAVWGRLIHGTNVVWLGPEAAVGPGPVADGLLTARPGLTVAMTFADCVPIWLGAAEPRVAGLLHAGWRGTVHNIAREGVAALAGGGVRPESLWAVIGPSIGPCCYEVGPAVAAEVEALELGPGLVDGRRHLDLWQTNRRLLERAGVPEGHIVATELCTACHAQWFFSHRRDGGRTGRNGGFIRLEAPA